MSASRPAVGAGSARCKALGWVAQQRASGRCAERIRTAGTIHGTKLRRPTGSQRRKRHPAELGTLGIQPGYSLIYDMGCIQGLPDEAAERAAEGITSLAADGGTLLFLAFARDRRMILPRGMDREHVETLFGPAWRLTDTHDMLALSAGKVPPPIRKARPTAYQLVKT